MAKKTIDKDLEQKCLKAYKALKAAYRKFELHKVIVMTGPNSSGKSLFRKGLENHIRAKFGIKDAVVAQWSLGKRAGLGFMNGDVDWMASSIETFRKYDGLSKLVSTENKPLYLVFDEPETAMSEEAAAGFALYLNEKLPHILDNTLGCLFISHSREFVKRLDNSMFINLDGMTEEEWLNREIVPIDPRDLREFSSAFLHYMHKHVKKDPRKEKRLIVK